MRKTEKLSLKPGLLCRNDVMEVYIVYYIRAAKVEWFDDIEYKRGIKLGGMKILRRRE